MCEEHMSHETFLSSRFVLSLKNSDLKRLVSPVKDTAPGFQVLEEGLRKGRLEGCMELHFC